MEKNILGIHHITAIAGEAQRNYDFYTKILGLRLVKKTVNFDDPETYHLYYGNQIGEPGTILTFFPWQRVKQGINGIGMATKIGLAVPSGSLDFWVNRFEENNIKTGQIFERFGENNLLFQDPDGLNFNLIVPVKEDKRLPWLTEQVEADNATRGFHNITLTVKAIGPTAKILTDIFGYELFKQEGNHYRFITNASKTASIVDIEELPDGKPGIVAGGTNHHVAFRVTNEEILMDFREKIAAHGLHITDKIDRNYFYSVYFREPGGILFELATDNPGFANDESIDQLGTHLKLPAQYEPKRSSIEKNLPKLI